MKIHHKLIFLGFLLVTGAAIVGLIVTGRVTTSETESARFPPGSVSNRLWVDQGPLRTAQALAPLAETPAERRQAREALRLADHEVDEAFAFALLMADRQSGNPPPAARAVQTRIQETQNQIDITQDRLKQLNAALVHARASQQENLQQQIELAQAELALDQDALADTKQDLIRVGGDPRARVQRLWDQHQAKQKASEAAGFPSPASGLAEAAAPSRSLLAKVRYWSTLRSRRSQLLAAQQEALAAAALLARDHEVLDQQVRQEQAQRHEQTHQAVSLLSGGKAGDVADSKQAAKAALSTLRRLSEDEKNLAHLDKRIEDFRDLSSAYGQWMDLVKSREMASLHDGLKSVLWVVLTLLLAFLLDRLIDRSFARLTLERRQAATLRAVVRFSIQALAVLVVLLVIFGSPNQLSTVLGLAGAGLTVALKDFVVSLCGWFVLMGRNGLHKGDWVEINGVRGEVIEIGLLRTVLLETGNWTDAGHPTGRQVAFLNSFAVEGYYFNFTTSGQWLWDELKLLIPWSVHNPYPLIEQIEAIAVKETEGDAQRAEAELQHVTHRYGVRSFSVTPAVNVRSTDPGVEVTVRYITRANERYEKRARLNHAALKLLHQEKTGAPAPEILPVPSVPGQS